MPPSFSGRIAHWYRSLDSVTRWTLLIIVIGIVLRFFVTWFVHPAGDSLSHLSTARYIAQTNTLPLFTPVYRPFFYYPPLFHLTAAGLFKIGALFSDFAAHKAMNFVAPLFGSAGLVVYYFFARKVVPKKIVLYSTIFLTFIPLHLYYSTLAHIDIAAAFMALLSLYLLYTKHFWLAALCNGAGMLTKYTHLFMVPTLLVRLQQRYRKWNSFVRRAVLFFAVAVVLGLPLFIRNFVYLGTPLWPFLNNVFMKLGMMPLLVETRPPASLLHFTDYTIPLRAYLDVFGVPLGLPSNLFGMGVPGVLLVIWFVGTLLFCIPFIWGLFVKKPSKLMTVLWVWIITFVVMMVYYIYDFGDIYMRLLLSIFPAIAIIWGYGFDRLLKKVRTKKLKKYVMVLLLLLCIGFSGVEVVKANIGAAQWENLQADHDWIQENLPADAVWDKHTGYVIYHTQRLPISMLCNESMYDQDKIYHYSYKNLKKDPPRDLYKDWAVIYNNQDTDVVVYKKTPP